MPGPRAAPPVKATLRIALPERSSPAGSSSAATTARVSARPVERQGAVDVGQGDHRRRGRSVAGEQGEGAEGRRLAAVDDRQGEARRRLLDPGDQDRREQGGQEAGSEEEPGGRQGAAGPVEDEHREGDDPHPVAQLVDRVADAASRRNCGLLRGSIRRDLRIVWLHELLHLCTRFPADAQVLGKLCYKLRKQLNEFRIAASNLKGLYSKEGNRQMGFHS